VAARWLGWACALALGWSRPMNVAAADAGWLVIEVEVNAPSDDAARIVRETEQALRARGLIVVDSRSAASRFEHEHSRAPYTVQPGEVEELDALLRRLAEQLTAENMQGVTATLAELSSKSPDQQDLLNRDMQRARRRFHACLSAAYLFDHQGQTSAAQEQLSACARDFPGFDPELPGLQSEPVRDFLSRARATLAAAGPSALRIEAESVRNGVRCFARVNGIDRGSTPVTLEKLRAPEVRVQVECGKQPARIYTVSVAVPQRTLRIDTRLDAAVVSRGVLKLSYPDAASADAARIKHGVVLARAVGASQLLEVFQGKLRRIDVASGRELASDAVSGGAAVAHAVDFVLSSGAPASQPRAVHRPIAEVRNPRSDALLRDEPSAPLASASDEPARTAPASRVFRTLAFAAAGATLIAATTAIVAWRVREGHIGKFNQRAECTDADPTELTPECRQELASSDSAGSIMLVGAVTGGATLVLTGVFFLLDANRRPDGAALACAGGPGDVGLACRLRF
jgi:hypothetical protein